MDSFIILLLLGVFTPFLSDTDNTALSKDIEMAGIFKFTAMRILEKENNVQEWILESLEGCTQSRKSKELWFDNHNNILMARMRQNHSDVHILQSMHGCEAEVQPRGGLKYVRGFFKYGYDGEDFLSFNATVKKWVAHMTEADAIKKKWDAVDILNLYTQGYLEKDCVQSLERFLKFQEEFFGKMDDSPPEVHVWAMESFQPGKRTLVCLVTDFFPKDVKVDIFRGKLRLDESDGVTSSAVRPSRIVVDGKWEMYQLRKTLEIEKSDTSEYSCVINHRTLSVPLETKWDSKCTCDVATPISVNIGDTATHMAKGGIIGGIIGVVITLLAVGLLRYWFKRWKLSCWYRFRGWILSCWYRFKRWKRGFLFPGENTNPPEVVVVDDGPGGRENGHQVPLLQDGQKIDAEPTDEKAENGSRMSLDSGKGSNSCGSSEEDVRNPLNKGFLFPGDPANPPEVVVVDDGPGGRVNGEHVPLTNGLKPDAGTMNGRENGHQVPLLQDGQKIDAEPTDGQQGADVV